MDIQVKRFFSAQFVELALDGDNDTYLLGIPFDHGGAGHVRYYVISKTEFDAGMADASSLKRLESNGVFLGTGELYWSSFVLDQPWVGSTYPR